MSRLRLKSIAIFFVVLGTTAILAYFGYRSNAEANVNRATLNYYKSLTEENSWNGKVVVLSKPDNCNIHNTSSSQWSGISVAAFENFLKSNSFNAKPIKLTSLEGVVPIISWKDNKRLHKASYNWKPEGQSILAISRIGFNNTLSKAVLCIQNIKPNMFGDSATLNYLERVDGKWVIKILRTVWVS